MSTRAISGSRAEPLAHAPTPCGQLVQLSSAVVPATDELGVVHDLGDAQRVAARDRGHLVGAEQGGLAETWLSSPSIITTAVSPLASTALDVGLDHRRPPARGDPPISSASADDPGRSGRCRGPRPRPSASLRPRIRSAGRARRARRRSSRPPAGRLRELRQVALSLFQRISAGAFSSRSPTGRPTPGTRPAATCSPRASARRRGRNESQADRVRPSGRVAASAPRRRALDQQLVVPELRRHPREAGDRDAHVTGCGAGPGQPPPPRRASARRDLPGAWVCSRRFTLQQRHIARARMGGGVHVERGGVVVDEGLAVVAKDAAGMQVVGGAEDGVVAACGCRRRVRTSARSARRNCIGPCAPALLFERMRLRARLDVGDRREDPRRARKTLLRARVEAEERADWQGGAGLRAPALGWRGELSRPSARSQDVPRLGADRAGQQRHGLSPQFPPVAQER